MPSIIEGSINNIFETKEMVFPGSMERIAYYDASIDTIGQIVVCCSYDDSVTGVFNLPSFGPIRDDNAQEAFDSLEEADEPMELGRSIDVPLIIETESIDRQMMKIIIEHRHWMSSN